MRRNRKPWSRAAGCAVVCAVLAAAAPAEAIPIVNVQYVETALGGGLFQYDYTVRNDSDPVADAGVDVYDLAWFFTAGSLVSAVLPDGWDAISGLGFLDTFSLAPGTSPLGTDIGPGQLLAGFSFVFDAQVGALTFQAVMTNPADPANPLLYDGATVDVATAGVPEPGTLGLMLAGGLFAALRRRSRKSRGRRTSSNQPFNRTREPAAPTGCSGLV
jgi:hypothetical protein